MHTYPAKSVYVFLQKIYTGNCERIENILHLLWCLFESLPNKYLGTVNSTVAQETAFMTEVSFFSVRPTLRLKKQLSMEY